MVDSQTVTPLPTSRRNSYRRSRPRCRATLIGQAVVEAVRAYDQADDEVITGLGDRRNRTELERRIHSLRRGLISAQPTTAAGILAQVLVLAPIAANNCLDPRQKADASALLISIIHGLESLSETPREAVGGTYFLPSTLQL